MNEVEINVKGVAYSCYPTAGAMLRFKRKTKKEISEINLNDIEDTGGFLFCCAQSGCRREEVPFPLSLMEFADNIDQGHLKAWQRAMQEAQAEEARISEEQKKACRSDRASGSLHWCGGNFV